MATTTRKLMLVGALSLIAALAIGTATAGAHGGPGRGGKRGIGKFGVSALVTEAAGQLDVTATRLKTAITDAAIARIDEAVSDEDLDADDAADLKAETRDNLSLAYRLSRASKVAANLGITATKLNSEFRDARRALYTKRIDDAVEDGELDADDAAELKQELADARLPGYKPSGFWFGFGFGFGHRR